MGLKSLIVRFGADERGATAVEYGLIIGLMVIAIIGGIASLGQSAGDSLQNSADTIEAA